MGYVGQTPAAAAVTSADITDLAIVNADVNASAALDFSKLAALSDGNILVGSGSNVAASVNPSGDVDVTNAGVFSIASDSVINADIKSDAAIAISKLATITLATNTSGDYVQNITAGTGLTSTGATSGENIAHSLSVDAAQTGITSVGALDAGSISSNFGTIDTGSSTITTTGSLQIQTIDYTDGDLAITIADGGGVTFAQNATFSGDVTLADDKDIKLGEAGKVNFVDVAPDDGEATGVVLSFIADVSLAIGDLVYIVADGSDGKVGKADSSAVGTMPAIGVAVTAVSADEAVEVLVQGLLRRNSAYGFTIGQDLFVSETPAAVTATAPTTSAATVQKVGVALHADIAYYNFNTTEVLLA